MPMTLNVDFEGFMLTLAALGAMTLLGLVGKAMAGTRLMIRTAWVRFPPCPDADNLLC